MSHSQFHCIMLILRHAWLNLWDKHMTTGRINQITPSALRAGCENIPIACVAHVFSSKKYPTGGATAAVYFPSKEVSTRRRAPPMASEVLALPSNPPNPTPLALTLSDRGCCCLCRPAGTVVRRLCLHWPWQPPSVSANVPRQIHLEATDVLIRCSLPWRIPVLCCSHTSLPPAVLNLTSALVSLVPPQLIVRTQPPHAFVSPQTAHCSTSLVPPQLIVRTQLASQPHRLPHSTDIPRRYSAPIADMVTI